MDKEFGRLTEEQLAGFMAMFQEVDSFFFEGESLRALEVDVLPWGRLYELPFGQVAGLAIVGIGLWDSFRDAAQSDDPQGAVLELGPEEDSPLGSPDEAEPWVLPTLIATLFNLRSVSKFQVPVSELVSRAADGDIRSMLRAIRLDPMSLQSEAIARIHSRATIRKDAGLLELIRRAQMGKSPRLPDSKLGNLRVAIRMLQEAGAMDSITVEQLRELVVDRLDLYPSGGDSHSAVRSEWRANKKNRGD